MNHLLFWEGFATGFLAAFLQSFVIVFYTLLRVYAMAKEEER